MYGKLDASEEEMIEVAKKAQAHDFIELLPQVEMLLLLGAVILTTSLLNFRKQLN
ncbi:MAG: hypothetical protein IH949_03795 [Bacteroidetes bacterium]|nr:hypothetical protein [Bacteroidota bacterium]